MHGTWLAETRNKLFFLQQNLCFAEKLEQVHFICRRLLKSEKMWCTFVGLTVSGYELFE